jgi:hypothetical protein
MEAMLPRACCSFEHGKESKHCDPIGLSRFGILCCQSELLRNISPSDPHVRGTKAHQRVGLGIGSIEMEATKIDRVKAGK